MQSNQKLALSNRCCAAKRNNISNWDVVIYKYKVTFNFDVHLALRNSSLTRMHFNHDSKYTCQPQYRINLFVALIDLNHRWKRNVLFIEGMNWNNTHLHHMTVKFSRKYGGQPDRQRVSLQSCTGNRKRRKREAGKDTGEQSQTSVH